MSRECTEEVSYGRSLSLAGCGGDHCGFLLCSQLLQPLLFVCGLLFFHALLRLLLCCHTLLLVVVVLFHTPLGIQLVSDELAVHAVHGHLARAACLLDTIPVCLVNLVVVGVILGLGHVCVLDTCSGCIHTRVTFEPNALSQNG